MVDHVASPAAERFTAARRPGRDRRGRPGRAFPGAGDLVVSPGFAPPTTLAAGLDVYSEPELAWRLRRPGDPPWLEVTLANGKTTTTTMLAAILTAAGLHRGDRQHRRAVGGPGRRARRARGGAVEFPAALVAPAGASGEVLLNLADDHLEWHGSFAVYAHAKTAIWRAAALSRDDHEPTRPTHPNHYETACL